MRLDLEKIMQIGHKVDLLGGRKKNNIENKARDTGIKNGKNLLLKNLRRLLKSREIVTNDFEGHFSNTNKKNRTKPFFMKDTQPENIRNL